MADLLSAEQLAAIEARARRACDYPVVDREWAVTTLVLVTALRKLKEESPPPADGRTDARRPALVPEGTLEQLQAQRDEAQARAERYRVALERVVNIAVDAWLGDADPSRFHEITETVVAVLAADAIEFDGH